MNEDIDLGGKPAPLKRVGTVTTIDAETGKVVSVKKNAAMLLPTRPGVCQECAVDHPHDHPHDQQSLTYQMRFHSTHGRWPTWTDAIAHIPDVDKPKWRSAIIQVFKDNGQPVPDDLMDPKPSGR